jgi:hypothetical protein
LYPGLAFTSPTVPSPCRAVVVSPCSTISLAIERGDAVEDGFGVRVVAVEAEGLV